MIPDDALASDAPAREQIRRVSVDEIQPNPEQPREVFDREELEGLSASIRTHGILSPLVVRQYEGQYILIAGERRWQAARMAGIAEVPVVIREAPDRNVQLELALVENLQRTDLDAVEEARGFARLVEEYGYTQDQIATAVGRDRSTVANQLRLLKLPAYVQQAMRDGRISAGHARALLPLSDEDAIRRVLGKISAQRLNVRQTERLVNEIVRTPASRGRGAAQARTHAAIRGEAARRRPAHQRGHSPKGARRRSNRDRLRGFRGPAALDRVASALGAAQSSAVACGSSSPMISRSHSAASASRPRSATMPSNASPRSVL